MYSLVATKKYLLQKTFAENRRDDFPSPRNKKSTIAIWLYLYPFSSRSQKKSLCGTSARSLRKALQSLLQFAERIAKARNTWIALIPAADSKPKPPDGTKPAIQNEIDSNVYWKTKERDSPLWHMCDGRPRLYNQSGRHYDENVMFTMMNYWSSAKNNSTQATGAITSSYQGEIWEWRIG